MEMESRENGDIKDAWSAPASPIVVLQKLSGEAVRVAGEACHSAYSRSSMLNIPILEAVPRHRRARSEVLTFRRSNSTSSFQKWKSQMQKALHWGSRSFRGDTQYSSFDPEILANQKRQWYQLHSKTLDPEKYKEPTSLFEHFVIVGLRPDANLEAVEDEFVRRKKWEQEMARTQMRDFNTRQNKQPTLPMLEPQVLFMYPPGKKLDLRLKDVAAFCFPEGVTARVLERTPSLSELNELVYGQDHLCRDDLSFVFSLKVADNATLYGVCLHVQEIVQKPSVISGVSSPLSQSHPGSSRFLVSAPRCYCLLTRVPFFELHYEMLNSIIAQERLDRITQFVNEIALADCVASPSKSKNNVNENLDSPSGESVGDWMASAIPIDSAMTLTAAAAGIISDEEVTSSRWELYSPGSATASDASDLSQRRDLDKDGNKNTNGFQDSNFETSDKRISGLDQMHKVLYNGHTPEIGAYVRQRSQSSEQRQSFESMLSSARSMISEEEELEMSTKHDKDPRNEMIMEWARENKNDLLQIICGYHSMPIPERGNEIMFKPLDHLQAIEYRRPPISALELCHGDLDLKPKDSKEASQVKLKLATAEEAVSLSLWSIATTCRVLSLQNVLTFVTGALLERQVVVLCPNLGVLSAVVLSVIPIIRPFEWQSLFLPILPENMLDFLDAPVPYVAGTQHKLADQKLKTSNLVQVDVDKKQVRSNLPLLPQCKKLISELGPLHSILSRQDSIAQRHPVYKCDEVQVDYQKIFTRPALADEAEAAAQFLVVMRRYLESLCSDLRLHTITSVQSNNDRVSILLKDSFIDSFPARDQTFIKLFVETQLFSVLSDSRLSSYEKEYS